MYEFDVLARPPAITEPVALTREGVLDVRARTARLFVVRFVVVLPRDVTLRVVVPVERVARVGVNERDETVRFAPVPRDKVVLDEVFVARDWVERDTVARFVVVAFARGLVRPVFWGKAFGFTIGSANTERIETKVEQTKNAAAKRNIVPMAFFIEFVFTRNVIKFSCLFVMRKTPKIRGFT